MALCLGSMYNKSINQLSTFHVVVRPDVMLEGGPGRRRKDGADDPLTLDVIHQLLQGLRVDSLLHVGEDCGDVGGWQEREGHQLTVESI